MKLEEINKILYVGASVTAQKNGFRPSLNKKLLDRFDKPISETVVATGATGSLFGLCNMSVIQLKGPYDLCFFEYSTGDLNLGLTPIDMLHGVLINFFEYLNTLSKNIVVIHNYRSDFEGDKGDQIRSIYNNVADSFNIPVLSVNKHMERIKDNLEGECWDVYYRDNVHSSEKGSEEIANYILNKVTEYNFKEKIEVSEYILKAVMQPLTGHIKPCGTYKYPSTQQIFPYIKIEAGKLLNFYLKGELWGLVPIVGPKSGWVRITADGVNISEFCLFDQHCYYTRVQPRVIRKKFEEFTKITVEILERNVDLSNVKKPHRDHNVLTREGAFSMLMGESLVLENVSVK